MTTSLNVLVAAYACNPLRGSEEAVGWDWVRQIASHHRTTVLTAEFHRRDIESVKLPQNLSFVYVPQKPWHYAPTPLWKKIEGSVAKPIMNLAYAQWQKEAYRLAHTLHATSPFDLAHQLTYVGFRFPGRLWKLGIPFVWGPIGGLENTPQHLLKALGPGGRIYYTGRNIINSAQIALLQSPRRAARAAGPGAIAATSQIAEGLRTHFGADPQVICEVTIPDALPKPKVLRRGGQDPLRLVWSGEHLPGKALILGLEALAKSRLPRDELELHILGDGPLRPHWSAQADHLGLGDICHWHGKRPRQEALAIMADAHVMLITSLKDLTSTVLVEAMALGLPIVCPNHCGFPDAVGKDSGILAPVDSIEALVAGLAQGIDRLGQDEDLRQKMGAAALVRSQSYSFDRKRAKIEAVYLQAMSKGA